MKKNIETIIFALLLGIICSSILIIANLYMAPFRDANAKAEEIMNLFAVLDVPFDPNADAKTLLEIFDNSIRITEFGELSVYEYLNAEEKVVGTAVFFAGSGLWGPVKGVLALEPNLVTIKGVSFYQQEETPGLGGEIASAAFQKQFIKKELISEDGQPGFIVTKPGEARTKNAVDGISGASVTSSRVQVMIDALARQLSEVRTQYVK